MTLPLTADLLLKAYSIGLFPMAESRGDRSLYWMDPEERGVMPLNAFHVPRKLKKLVRSDKFTVTVDRAFDAVMRGCAEPAPGREDTWINDDILMLYSQLHRLGGAHSVEVWLGERLVGGLYGVSLGSAFFGESMFSRETNASKVALVHLVARLIKGGYSLLDCQFVNDHLLQFGVIEVPRDTYREHLGHALKQVAHLPDHIQRDEWSDLFAHMSSAVQEE